MAIYPECRNGKLTGKWIAEVPCSLWNVVHTDQAPGTGYPKRACVYRALGTLEDA